MAGDQKVDTQKVVISQKHRSTEMPTSGNFADATSRVKKTQGEVAKKEISEAKSREKSLVDANRSAKTSQLIPEQKTQTQITLVNQVELELSRQLNENQGLSHQEFFALFESAIKRRISKKKDSFSSLHRIQKLSEIIKESLEELEQSENKVDTATGVNDVLNGLRSLVPCGDLTAKLIVGSTSQDNSQDADDTPRNSKDFSAEFVAKFKEEINAIGKINGENQEEILKISKELRLTMLLALNGYQQTGRELLEQLNSKNEKERNKALDTIKKISFNCSEEERQVLKICVNKSLLGMKGPTAEYLQRWLDDKNDELTALRIARRKDIEIRLATDRKNKTLGDTNLSLIKEFIHISTESDRKFIRDLIDKSEDGFYLRDKLIEGQEKSTANYVLTWLNYETSDDARYFVLRKPIEDSEVKKCLSNRDDKSSRFKYHTDTKSIEFDTHTVERYLQQRNKYGTSNSELNEKKEQYESKLAAILDDFKSAYENYLKNPTNKECERDFNIYYNLFFERNIFNATSDELLCFRTFITDGISNEIIINGTTINENTNIDELYKTILLESSESLRKALYIEFSERINKLETSTDEENSKLQFIKDYISFDERKIVTLTPIASNPNDLITNELNRIFQNLPIMYILEYDSLIDDRVNELLKFALKANLTDKDTLKLAINEIIGEDKFNNTIESKNNDKLTLFLRWLNEEDESNLKGIVNEIRSALNPSFKQQDITNTTNSDNERADAQKIATQTQNNNTHSADKQSDVELDEYLRLFNISDSESVASKQNVTYTQAKVKDKLNFEFDIIKDIDKIKDIDADNFIEKCLIFCLGENYNISDNSDEFREVIKGIIIRKIISGINSIFSETDPNKYEYCKEQFTKIFDSIFIENSGLSDENLKNIRKEITEKNTTPNYQSFCFKIMTNINTQEYWYREYLARSIFELATYSYESYNTWYERQQNSENSLTHYNLSRLGISIENLESNGTSISEKEIRKFIVGIIDGEIDRIDLQNIQPIISKLDPKLNYVVELQELCGNLSSPNEFNNAIKILKNNIKINHYLCTEPITEENIQKIICSFDTIDEYDFKILKSVLLPIEVTADPNDKIFKPVHLLNSVLAKDNLEDAKRADGLVEYYTQIAISKISMIDDVDKSIDTLRNDENIPSYLKEQVLDIVKEKINEIAKGLEKILEAEGLTTLNFTNEENRENLCLIMLYCGAEEFKILQDSLRASEQIFATNSKIDNYIKNLLGCENIQARDSFRREIFKELAEKYSVWNTQKSFTDCTDDEIKELSDLEISETTVGKLADTVSRLQNVSYFEFSLIKQEGWKEFVEGHFDAQKYNLRDHSVTCYQYELYKEFFNKETYDEAHAFAYCGALPNVDFSKPYFIKMDDKVKFLCAWYEIVPENLRDAVLVYYSENIKKCGDFGIELFTDRNEAIKYIEERIKDYGENFEYDILQRINGNEGERFNNKEYNELKTFITNSKLVSEEEIQSVFFDASRQYLKEEVEVILKRCDTSIDEVEKNPLILKEIYFSNSCSENELALLCNYFFDIIISNDHTKDDVFLKGVCDVALTLDDDNCKSLTSSIQSLKDEILRKYGITSQSANGCLVYYIDDEQKFLDNILAADKNDRCILRDAVKKFSKNSEVKILISSILKDISDFSLEDRVEGFKFYLRLQEFRERCENDGLSSNMRLERASLVMDWYSFPKDYRERCLGKEINNAQTSYREFHGPMRNFIDFNDGFCDIIGISDVNTFENAAKYYTKVLNYEINESLRDYSSYLNLENNDERLLFFIPYGLQLARIFQNSSFPQFREIGDSFNQKLNQKLDILSPYAQLKFARDYFEADVDTRAQLRKSFDEQYSLPENNEILSFLKNFLDGDLSQESLNQFEKTLALNVANKFGKIRAARLKYDEVSSNPSFYTAPERTKYHDFDLKFYDAMRQDFEKLLLAFEDNPTFQEEIKLVSDREFLKSSSIVFFIDGMQQYIQTLPNGSSSLSEEFLAHRKKLESSFAELLLSESGDPQNIINKLYNEGFNKCYKYDSQYSKLNWFDQRSYSSPYANCNYVEYIFDDDLYDKLMEVNQYGIRDVVLARYKDTPQKLLNAKLREPENQGKRICREFLINISTDVAKPYNQEIISVNKPLTTNEQNVSIDDLDEGTRNLLNTLKTEETRNDKVLETLTQLATIEVDLELDGIYAQSEDKSKILEAKLTVFQNVKEEILQKLSENIHGDNIDLSYEYDIQHDALLVTKGEVYIAKYAFLSANDEFMGEYNPYYTEKHQSQILNAYKELFKTQIGQSESQSVFDYASNVGSVDYETRYKNLAFQNKNELNSDNADYINLEPLIHRAAILNHDIKYVTTRRDQRQEPKLPDSWGFSFDSTCRAIAENSCLTKKINNEPLTVHEKVNEALSFRKPQAFIMLCDLINSAKGPDEKEEIFRKTKVILDNNGNIHQLCFICKYDGKNNDCDLRILEHLSKGEGVSDELRHEAFSIYQNLLAKKIASSIIAERVRKEDLDILYEQYKGICRLFAIEDDDNTKLQPCVATEFNRLLNDKIDTYAKRLAESRQGVTRSSNQVKIQKEFDAFRDNVISNLKLLNDINDDNDSKILSLTSDIDTNFDQRLKRYEAIIARANTLVSSAQDALHHKNLYEVISIARQCGYNPELKSYFDKIFYEKASLIYVPKSGPTFAGAIQTFAQAIAGDGEGKITFENAVQYYFSQGDANTSQFFAGILASSENNMWNTVSNANGVNKITAFLTGHDPEKYGREVQRMVSSVYIQPNDIASVYALMLRNVVEYDLQRFVPDGIQTFLGMTPANLYQMMEDINSLEPTQKFVIDYIRENKQRFDGKSETEIAYQHADEIQEAYVKFIKKEIEKELNELGINKVDDWFEAKLSNQGFVCERALSLWTGESEDAESYSVIMKLAKGDVEGFCLEFEQLIFNSDGTVDFEKLNHLKNIATKHDLDLQQMIDESFGFKQAFKMFSNAGNINVANDHVSIWEDYAKALLRLDKDPNDTYGFKAKVYKIDVIASNSADRAGLMVKFFTEPLATQPVLNDDGTINEEKTKENASKALQAYNKNLVDTYDRIQPSGCKFEDKINNVYGCDKTRIGRVNVILAAKDTGKISLAEQAFLALDGNFYTDEDELLRIFSRERAYNLDGLNDIHDRYRELTNGRELLKDIASDTFEGGDLKFDLLFYADPNKNPQSVVEHAEKRINYEDGIIWKYADPKKREEMIRSFNELKSYYYQHMNVSIGNDEFISKAKAVDSLADDFRDQKRMITDFAVNAIEKVGTGTLVVASFFCGAELITCAYIVGGTNIAIIGTKKVMLGESYNYNELSSDIYDFGQSEIDLLVAFKAARAARSLTKSSFLEGFAAGATYQVADSELAAIKDIVSSDFEYSSDWSDDILSRQPGYVGKAAITGLIFGALNHCLNSSNKLKSESQIEQQTESQSKTKTNANKEPQPKPQTDVQTNPKLESQPKTHTEQSTEVHHVTNPKDGVSSEAYNEAKPMAQRDAKVSANAPKDTNVNKTNPNSKMNPSDNAKLAKSNATSRVEQNSSHSKKGEPGKVANNKALHYDKAPAELKDGKKVYTKGDGQKTLKRMNKDNVEKLFNDTKIEPQSAGQGFRVSTRYEGKDPQKFLDDLMQLDLSQIPRNATLWQGEGGEMFAKVLVRDGSGNLFRDSLGNPLNKFVRVVNNGGIAYFPNISLSNDDTEQENYTINDPNSDESYRIQAEPINADESLFNFFYNPKFVRRVVDNDIENEEEEKSTTSKSSELLRSANEANKTNEKETKEGEGALSNKQSDAHKEGVGILKTPDEEKSEEENKITDNQHNKAQDDNTQTDEAQTDIQSEENSYKADADMTQNEEKIDEAVINVTLSVKSENDGSVNHIFSEEIKDEISFNDTLSQENSINQANNEDNINTYESDSRSSQLESSSASINFNNNSNNNDDGQGGETPSIQVTSDENPPLNPSSGDNVSDSTNHTNTVYNYNSFKTDYEFTYEELKQGLIAPNNAYIVVNSITKSILSEENIEARFESINGANEYYLYRMNINSSYNDSLNRIKTADSVEISKDVINGNNEIKETFINKAVNEATYLGILKTEAEVTLYRERISARLLRANNRVRKALNKGITAQEILDGELNSDALYRRVKRANENEDEAFDISVNKNAENELDSNQDIPIKLYGNEYDAYIELAQELLKNSRISVNDIVENATMEGSLKDEIPTVEFNATLVDTQATNIQDEAINEAVRITLDEKAKNVNDVLNADYKKDVSENRSDQEIINSILNNDVVASLTETQKVTITNLVSSRILQCRSNYEEQGKNDARNIDNNLDSDVFLEQKFDNYLNQISEKLRDDGKCEDYIKGYISVLEVRLGNIDVTLEKLAQILSSNEGNNLVNDVYNGNMSLEDAKDKILNELSEYEKVSLGEKDTQYVESQILNMISDRQQQIIQGVSDGQNRTISANEYKLLSSDNTNDKNQCEKDIMDELAQKGYSEGYINGYIEALRGRVNDVSGVVNEIFNDIANGNIPTDSSVHVAGLLIKDVQLANNLINEALAKQEMLNIAAQNVARNEVIPGDIVNSNSDVVNGYIESLHGQFSNKAQMNAFDSVIYQRVDVLQTENGKNAANDAINSDIFYFEQKDVGGLEVWLAGKIEGLRQNGYGERFVTSFEGTIRVNLDDLSKKVARIDKSIDDLIEKAREKGKDVALGNITYDDALSELTPNMAMIEGVNLLHLRDIVTKAIYEDVEKNRVEFINENNRAINEEITQGRQEATNRGLTIEDYNEIIGEGRQNWIDRETEELRNKGASDRKITAYLNRINEMQEEIGKEINLGKALADRRTQTISDYNALSGTEVEQKVWQDNARKELLDKGYTEITANAYIERLLELHRESVQRLKVVENVKIPSSVILQQNNDKINAFLNSEVSRADLRTETERKLYNTRLLERINEAKEFDNIQREEGKRVGQEEEISRSKYEEINRQGVENYVKEEEKRLEKLGHSKVYINGYVEAISGRVNNILNVTNEIFNDIADGRISTASDVNVEGLLIRDIEFVKELISERQNIQEGYNERARALAQKVNEGELSLSYVNADEKVLEGLLDSEVASKNLRTKAEEEAYKTVRRSYIQGKQKEVGKKYEGVIQEAKGKGRDVALGNVTINGAVESLEDSIRSLQGVNQEQVREAVFNAILNDVNKNGAQYEKEYSNEVKQEILQGRQEAEKRGLNKKDYEALSENKAKRDIWEESLREELIKQGYSERKINAFINWQISRFNELDKNATSAICQELTVDALRNEDAMTKFVNSLLERVNSEDKEAYREIINQKINESLERVERENEKPINASAIISEKTAQEIARELVERKHFISDAEYEVALSLKAQKIEDARGKANVIINNVLQDGTTVQTLVNNSQKVYELLTKISKEELDNIKDVLKEVVSKLPKDAKNSQFINNALNANSKEELTELQRAEGAKIGQEEEISRSKYEEINRQGVENFVKEERVKLEKESYSEGYIDGYLKELETRYRNIHDYTNQILVKIENGSINTNNKNIIPDNQLGKDTELANQIVNDMLSIQEEKILRVRALAKKANEEALPSEVLTSKGDEDKKLVEKELKKLNFATEAEKETYRVVRLADISKKRKDYERVNYAKRSFNSANTENIVPKTMKEYEEVVSNSGLPKYTTEYEVYRERLYDAMKKAAYKRNGVTYEELKNNPDKLSGLLGKISYEDLEILREELRVIELQDSLSHEDRAFIKVVLNVYSKEDLKYFQAHRKESIEAQNGIDRGMSVQPQYADLVRIVNQKGNEREEAIKQYVESRVEREGLSLQATKLFDSSLSHMIEASLERIENENEKEITRSTIISEKAPKEIARELIDRKHFNFDAEYEVSVSLKAKKIEELRNKERSAKDYIKQNELINEFEKIANSTKYEENLKASLNERMVTINKILKNYKIDNEIVTINYLTNDVSKLYELLIMIDYKDFEVLKDDLYELSNSYKGDNANFISKLLNSKEETKFNTILRKEGNRVANEKVEIVDIYEARGVQNWLNSKLNDTRFNNEFKKGFTQYVNANWIKLKDSVRAYKKVLLDVNNVSNKILNSDNPYDIVIKDIEPKLNVISHLDVKKATKRIRIVLHDNILSKDNNELIKESRLSSLISNIKSLKENLINKFTFHSVKSNSVNNEFKNNANEYTRKNNDSSVRESYEILHALVVKHEKIVEELLVPTFDNSNVIDTIDTKDKYSFNDISKLDKLFENIEFDNKELEHNIKKLKNKNSKIKFGYDKKLIFRTVRETVNLLILFNKLNINLSADLQKRLLTMQIDYNDKSDMFNRILKSYLLTWKNLKSKKAYEKLLRMRIYETQRYLMLMLLEIMTHNTDEINDKQNEFKKFVGSLPPELKKRVKVDEVFKKLIRAVGSDKFKKFINKKNIVNIKELIK